MSDELPGVGEVITDALAKSLPDEWWDRYQLCSECNMVVERDQPRGTLSSGIRTCSEACSAALTARWKAQREEAEARRLHDRLGSPTGGSSSTSFDVTVRRDLYEKGLGPVIYEMGDQVVSLGQLIDHLIELGEDLD